MDSVNHDHPGSQWEGYVAALGCGVMACGCLCFYFSKPSIWRLLYESKKENKKQSSQGVTAMEHNHWIAPPPPGYSPTRTWDLGPTCFLVFGLWTSSGARSTLNTRQCISHRDHALSPALSPFSPYFGGHPVHWSASPVLTQTCFQGLSATPTLAAIWISLGGHMGEWSFNRDINITED